MSSNCCGFATGCRNFFSCRVPQTQKVGKYCIIQNKAVASPINGSLSETALNIVCVCQKVGLLYMNCVYRSAFYVLLSNDRLYLEEETGFQVTCTPPLSTLLVLAHNSEQMQCPSLIETLR